MDLISGIDFSDALDRDGDMGIELSTGNDYKNIWINKDEAMLIINHLKKTFEIIDEG